ncbi:MAG: DNA primase, partial [Lachnospiraceae bacterium]|nr:DNA primase [Lachnospiraceae bacterium]
EEVERDNYLQAVADKYFIGIDNLRKLVVKYAASGVAKPIERPKSGLQSKNSAHDGPRRAQKLLISWIADYPQIYSKIKAYVSPEDFTEEIYRLVAEKMFQAIEKGQFSPAEVINAFEDAEQQKEAAELFYEELPPMEKVEEREQALRDVILAVKKNSLEHYKQMQSDRSIEAVTKVIEGKKALQELAKLHISLD